MINVLHMVAHGVKGKGGEQGVNGPELRTLNSFKYFNTAKYNMIVAYSSNGKLWNEFNKIKIPVIDFFVKSKYDFISIINICKIIRKYNIDIIHTQGPGSLDFYATISARITGTKIIVTRPIMISDLKVPAWIRLLYKIMDKFTLRFAHRIVAVSKAGQRQLISKSNASPEETILIYNGVDLSRFFDSNKSPKDSWGIPKDFPVVGACAQLTHNKGWWDFFDAFAKLKNEIPEVRALVMGDGPLRLDMEKHAVEIGIKDAVVFTGYLPNVEKALKCLDLLLFLSRREGLSVAVIEAMACGLPCVLSDVGGAREQVRNGVNGYVVPRGQTDKAADCAAFLLKNQDLRKKAGEASRKICEELFDVKNMVKKYQDLYSDLAAQSSKEISS